MSTDTLDLSPADRPSGSGTDPTAPTGDGDGGRLDEQDRGRTDVADAVVEKIASRAATEVDHVGGTARRVLGVAVGSDGADSSPKVRARVDGSIVVLDVRLSVTYPAPVGLVTRQVRDHLIERISALTGLSVRQVDITVTALHQPRTQHRELT